MMKQNMMLVCYDYDITKRLAQKFASIFSMIVFDQRELFEFDHIPHTFSEILKENGNEYVLKKFKSILKGELEFENAIFIADSSFAENCFDIFYKIKLNNFVIFFYKDIKSENYLLSNKKYQTNVEKNFYAIDEGTLRGREKLIKEECSDISVDITNLSDDEIVKKTLDYIQKYYAI